MIAGTSLSAFSAHGASSPTRAGPARAAQLHQIRSTQEAPRAPVAAPQPGQKLGAAPQQGQILPRGSLLNLSV
jgi:hypothetical protein